MAQQEQPGIVVRLQQNIDAVLVPHGFAAGGIGGSDGQRQILWCLAADDFAARFPRLPTSQEPPEGWGTTCTDVVIDVATTGDGWRVTGVSVEGDDLGRLLTGLGLIVAAEHAATLIGSPAHGCLVQLPRLLLELLEGSRSEP